MTSWLCPWITAISKACRRKRLGLKTEAALYTATMVYIQQTTWRHIPEWSTEYFDTFVGKVFDMVNIHRTTNEDSCVFDPSNDELNPIYHLLALLGDHRILHVSRIRVKYIPCILYTYLLTHSKVQSPSWEANWFAASQEIPRISRNPKVHYRTHKRPPPVSILGQPNPVHIPTSHLLETFPNIIHPSTPRSPQWSPSLRFPHQDPIHPLSSPIRTTCPAHLILLDFITRTILGEEYKSSCNLYTDFISTNNAKHIFFILTILYYNLYL